MNKSELIAEVATKAEITKKDAEAAVTAVIDAITESLKKGDKVQLVGFGSFEVKSRAARTGLSIARSIAEVHHGSIRAIVDDGKITFTAELK